MIQLWEPAGAGGEAQVLRAMYAARKRVFVDLLGWDVPVLAGQYEIDQFDDPNAQYLILTDLERRHMGSARLLPTTRPHILEDLFAHLCDDAPPTGPGIFEITRFCLDPAPRAVERRQVRNQLVTALVEHALANGVHAYTGVADAGWMAQILKFGWRCRQLGATVERDGQHLGALRIEVDADTPALLAATGIWSPAARAGVSVAVAA